MRIRFHVVFIILIIYTIITPAIRISGSEYHASFQAMIFPLQPSSINSDSHLFFLHDVIDYDVISFDLYHTYNRNSNNGWKLGNKIIGERSTFSIVNYQYINQKSWSRPIMKEGILSSYFISDNNLVYSIFTENSSWEGIKIISYQEFFQKASLEYDRSIKYQTLFDTENITLVVWQTGDNLGDTNNKFFISEINAGSVGETSLIGEIERDIKSTNVEDFYSIIMNGSVPIIYSPNMDQRSVFKNRSWTDFESVKWNTTNDYNRDFVSTEFLINNKYLLFSYFEVDSIQQSIYFLDLTKTILTPKIIDLRYELKIRDVPLIIHTKNENITIGFVTDKKIVWGNLDLNMNRWNFTVEKMHNKILTFGTGRQYFFEGIESDDHISIFLDMYADNLDKEIYEYEYGDKDEENIVQVTNNILFSDDFKSHSGNGDISIKYIFGMFGLVVLILQKRSNRNRQEEE